MKMPDDYTYKLSYNSKNKSFLGYVISPGGFVVFEVENAVDMMEIIDAGYMNHIDDVQGLEDMLKQEGTINNFDTVVFGGAYEHE